MLGLLLTEQELAALTSELIRGESEGRRPTSNHHILLTLVMTQDESDHGLG